MVIHEQQRTSCKAILQQLVELGKIRSIDRAFADFIEFEEADLEDDGKICITLLAAYLSASAGEQHSCVELKQLGQPFVGVYEFPKIETIFHYLKMAQTVLWLGNEFSNSPVSALKPIVLQKGALYLHRYWQYEVDLAANIGERAVKFLEVDFVAAKALLAELFPESGKIQNKELDWQKIAVCVSASQNVSFITGGPGTGKTTTVTKLLALLQGLAVKKGQILNIQLVAPTGKAAARLTESIRSAKKKLPEHLQKHLPEQCQTIHRLLGAKPKSPYFKADAQHPLHLDVLVLDEASMVDLALMAKLFSAVPKTSQVILLGDQEQLASVETGSVLSDICSAHGGHDEGKIGSLGGFSDVMLRKLQQLMDIEWDEQGEVNKDNASVVMIRDNLVRLVKSHRFDENSGIGSLAKSIQQGNLAAVYSLLKSETLADIQWYEPVQTSKQGLEDEILNALIVRLMPILKQYFSAVKEGKLALAFECLYKQQVLCAQKSGYWGVLKINTLIENELHKQGVVDKARDFYVGRPIMLAKNDHQINLFNGDIGIVMPDPDNQGLMKVWFYTSEGELRGILPNRLPAHDTLYAMTIHKSQGSEFNTVYMCLPKSNNEGSHRGLSKELLYTGLTRAKEHFVLFAEKRAIHTSISRQCIRGSGLAKRLIRQ